MRTIATCAPWENESQDSVLWGERLVVKAAGGAYISWRDGCAKTLAVTHPSFHPDISCFLMNYQCDTFLKWIPSVLVSVRVGAKVGFLEQQAGPPSARVSNGRPAYKHVSDLQHPHSVIHPRSSFSRRVARLRIYVRVLAKPQSTTLLLAVCMLLAIYCPYWHTAIIEDTSKRCEQPQCLCTTTSAAVTKD